MSLSDLRDAFEHEPAVRVSVGIRVRAKRSQTADDHGQRLNGPPEDGEEEGLGLLDASVYS